MDGEKLVYWDSDLFIALIQRTPDRIGVLEPLSQAAERGELRIVTSILAKAECAFIRNSPLLPEEQEQAIVDFFDNPYLTVVPLDDFVCEHARRIIRANAGTGLRSVDAIHIATAVHAEVPTLHAYDKAFFSVHNGIAGLTIEEPRCDQWMLFSPDEEATDDAAVPVDDAVCEEEPPVEAEAEASSPASTEGVEAEVADAEPQEELPTTEATDADDHEQK